MHFFFDNTLQNKPILNQIGVPAAAAYSLRKLKSGVTNAIRVRRSNDNQELDIPFCGNDLCQTTLTAFVGANSAFVTTWYDQSGNGNNAVQTTVGIQPRIVNAGVLDVQGGKPSIYFDGVGYLATASFDAFDSGFHAQAISKVQQNVTYNAIFSKANGGTAGPFHLFNDSFFIGNGLSESTRFLTTGFYQTSPLSLWGYAGSASNGYAWLNGVNNVSSTAAPTVYADYGSPLLLGARSGSPRLNGYISECIFYPTVLSGTNRQKIERNQGKYFGIAVA